MDLENRIQDALLELLTKVGSQLNKIKIEKKSPNIIRVNIETSDTNMLIGHHGENIFALQHILKIILFKDNIDQVELQLDIDNYRRRQEQNIIQMVERKAISVRKTQQAESLPAMSPYFRRLVHTHLAQDKFKDLLTESSGEGEFRYVIIKPQLI